MDSAQAIKTAMTMNLSVFKEPRGVMRILQFGIVPHEGKFIDFVTGWPGSTHGNRMFNNSRICLQFEQEVRQDILLGDSRYDCRPFLMTPVLNPTTSAEEAYNASYIPARNIVERAFGCWKKFQSFTRKITLKLNNIAVVIVATVVLHNIAADRGLLEEPDNREDDIIAHQRPPQPLGVTATRNIIPHYFN